MDGDRLSGLWVDWLSYGALGGLVALPFIGLQYWQSTDHYSLGAVFLGGIVAGYLCRADRKGIQRAGLVAGAVGGLPLFLVFREVLVGAVTIPNPLWFRAVSLVLLGGFVAVVVGLAAVVGMFGARLGSWLAGKTGRRRSSATGR